MKNLCEIFKVGTHTASNGVSKTYTKADLDKIVQNFETSNPDVPICVGHPQGQAPAYGWVKSVCRIGDKLYCDFKQVQNEFKKAVNSGLFKTRSISLAPNMTLKHIAFLGAKAPAIKGMEEFCFENCENTFEFSEIEPFEFTTTKTDDRKDKNMTNKNVDYEEQLTAKDAEIAELKAKNEELKKISQQKEFEDFCEKSIADGNILPSQKDCVMEILQNLGGSFNFEESSQLEALDGFKKFISGLKQLTFSEIANSRNIDNSLDFEDSKSVKIAIEKEIAKLNKGGIEVDALTAFKNLKGGK